MDFQLTTWERLTISQLIGRLQGDAALMHKAIKVFDAVELTEAERQAVNLRQAGDVLVQNQETFSGMDKCASCSQPKVAQTRSASSLAESVAFGSTIRRFP